MNFGERVLDDETKAFWRDCRAFFDEVVTEEVHAEERATGGGFSESVHKALGARGWVAPTWPVDEGGAGLDPLKAKIVALELARSGAPNILASTTLLPPIALRMFASDELKDKILPGIAEGSIRICLGYTEPDCGSDLAAVRTRAVRDRDGWLINGQKMFTTGAQFAQYCFCLTRTNLEVSKHRGLTVFLVPLDLPGIEITPIGTLGGERTNFVHFDDVRLDDRFRIGEVDAGWHVVSAPLALEHGLGKVADDDAEAGRTYGRHTRLLLSAVLDVLRSGSAPDGHPLDDPNVLERLARVQLDVDVAELTPGPMGRVLAAETLIRDASDLLELLGDASIVARGEEHAAAGGAVEEAFRFAPGTTIYGGSTEVARNMIAEHMLGLPRSTPPR